MPGESIPTTACHSIQYFIHLEKSMRRTIFFSYACTAGAMLLAAQGALAQNNYPNRPVRMITSAAGGSSDFAARLVSYSASPGLGQQIIIDNRGGGVQAIEIVTRAS